MERLTENQNSDIRKGTGNDWPTVRCNQNSRGASTRQNAVPEFQNLYFPLEVEDVPRTNFGREK